MASGTPIKCYEYLGRFYVEEGNKRVSVLKSYGAATIPGQVTRMVPVETQDLAIQRYYEFMDFYRLAGIYQVQFERLGSYAKLQAALGYEPGYIWTKEERKSFLSSFARFQRGVPQAGRRQSQRHPGRRAAGVAGRQPLPQALKDMTAAELSKSITAVWPDIKAAGRGRPHCHQHRAAHRRAQRHSVQGLRQPAPVI